MKLFLAGASTGLKYFDNLWEDKKRCNFLESYLYFGKRSMQDFVEKLWKQVFLDSGAFSAFTIQKEIDIYKYIEFIKKNKNSIITYAWLDVIWDAEETLENLKVMKRAWLSPLPTYHFGSPAKYLHNLLNENDYIGIGGLVPYARKPNKIQKVLDYVFRYISKNNLKTKLHWRGMTNPRFMLRYPFYTVDSTWWLAGGKFKTIQFFDKTKGMLRSDNAEGLRRKTWRDFGKMRYREINNHNIIQIYDFVDYVDRLHTTKGMKYWEK